MGLQELKSSGCVLYSVQTTQPEAGGQVGEVPEAVSWDGDLGPLVVAVALARREPAAAFPACWGHEGRRM